MFIRVIRGELIENWKLKTRTSNVIQSEAKNLDDTAQPKVDAPEILRRDAPLDDKIMEEINKTKSDTIC